MGLRQIGMVAHVGMAICLGMAIVLSSFVRLLLFQTSALDPVAVVMACGGMLLITLGAAFIAISRTRRGDLSRGIRRLRAGQVYIGRFAESADQPRPMR